jgi:hypothetical protein
VPNGACVVLRNTVEGRISRADLADVCTQLLFLPDARGKTLEVVAAPAGQAPSLASAVAALEPDADAGSELARRPVKAPNRPDRGPTKRNAVARVSPFRP